MAAKGAIIGIDLGTSNSAVAVVKDGTPVIIKVEADRPTLPSVISLGQVTFTVVTLSQDVSKSLLSPDCIQLRRIL